MGIFSFFSNIFNKNIECDDIVYDYIVFRDDSKKVLYYNNNIVVSPDINAVVVCKSKVCDVLPMGKYKIISSALPNTFKKINFEKYEKKYNKPIAKFKAEVYFVNMRERVDFHFTSDEPFYFKTEKFGKVFGFVDGVCSIRVVDSEALAKALIYGEKRIDIAKVNENIGLWIGNWVNKKLEKSKFKFEDLVLNHKLMDDYIANNINGAFDKIGFVIKDVSIKCFRTSPKTQKKINDFISKHKSMLKNIKLGGINMSQKMVVTISPNRTKREGADTQYRGGMVKCKYCGHIHSSGHCTKCGGKN